MPAAIAIPAIIGAAGVGASVYGANKASNAAKSAAAQQQLSVNQAQQFAQQAWQQQQQALSPYRQMGQNALANLMQRQYGPGGTQGMNAGQVGMQNAPGWQGGGFSLASLRPGGGGMPGGPQGQMPMNQGPPPGGPQGPPQGAPTGPWGPMPGMPPGGGMQQPMGGPMSAGGPVPQPPGGAGGGLVTVQDDSGATRQVPQAMAQLYAQRGFKVMG